MGIVVLEGSHCSGKSTMIKELKNNLNFVESKSVPGWFRRFLPFARSQKMNIQKFIYNIGHMFSYTRAKLSKNDYVFDRWKYTTIIRLCYENNLPLETSIKQIESLKIKPDLVIMLKATPELIKVRGQLRDGEKQMPFDEKFYKYENAVFEYLAFKYPNQFKIVENTGKVEEAFFKIEELLIEKGIVSEDVKQPSIIEKLNEDEYNKECLQDISKVTSNIKTESLKNYLENIHNSVSESNENKCLVDVPNSSDDDIMGD